MIFNSLIPLPFYTAVFYNGLLIIVLFLILHVLTKGVLIEEIKSKDYTSFLLLLIVTLYLGLRPISGRYFGDMGSYYNKYQNFAQGGEINSLKDYFWDVFMKLCSGFISAKSFFLLCAILYVFPLYFACKKWLGTNKYVLFLMFIASFSFWAYGTNGIRNGIATSFFLLAVSITNKKYLKAGVLLIAFLIHGSIIIPISAYVLTLFYKNPKHYLYGWLVCIIISLALGDVFNDILISLGYGDDRVAYLTDQRFKDQFAYTGFRWDFLLYSATAVFAGFYFIIKKKFNDKVYIQLFNLYLITNAFWILVIRASFSNRFAYLSWFLMAVIIFYPFFKKRFFKSQKIVLTKSILAYYGFTYIMFLLLS